MDKVEIGQIDLEKAERFLLDTNIKRLIMRDCWMYVESSNTRYQQEMRNNVTAYNEKLRQAGQLTPDNYKEYDLEPLDIDKLAADTIRLFEKLTRKVFEK